MSDATQAALPVKKTALAASKAINIQDSRSAESNAGIIADQSLNGAGPIYLADTSIKAAPVPNKTESTTIRLFVATVRYTIIPMNRGVRYRPATPLKKTHTIKRLAYQRR
jgi:hypothetical protein